MYTNLDEPPPKFHILIYIGSTLVLGLFAIIDLALQEWFKYCYFNFGLIYGDSTFDGYSNENTISDIKDDFCNGGAIETYIKNACPGFCDNVDHFQTAGGLMIAFSIFTFIGFCFTLIMHIMLLCRKRISFRFSWLFMILPFVSYFAGFVFYCIAADTSNIKGVKKAPPQVSNPKNFKWEGGMIFAVIIIVFLCANMVHGLIFTKRHLIPNNNDGYSKRASGQPLQ